MVQLSILVFPPGYYKTNYRALRLREMLRWYGWQRGFKAWFKTRFTRPTRGGWWMPGLWVENECKQEDLSPDFWQATKPHRRNFEQLGFAVCGFSKQTKTLSQTIRDSGGISYLDPTRRYFGQLLYVRVYRPARRVETNEIVIAFTAMFENGSLSCTNHRKSFDSLETSEVIRLNSYDVNLIYRRFQEELPKRPDPPRSFPDLESLRQWFDARQVKIFENRVRRRLFVPMTDPEIAAARAALQSVGSGAPPPLPRRRLRLEFWPMMIALLLILHIVYRHLQAPGNSFEYQGQHFKMRLPYASYEDYKDDPNNLDTNELGRIEQTMESAKIPTSFKDREAFIHFMVFDLEFPGYGLSSIGGNMRTDDGSTLEVESVEIPQADKDRVVVVREFGDQLKLVDDFIYDTAGTNAISRVEMEHSQLRYFDNAGHSFREKSF